MRKEKAIWLFAGGPMQEPAAKKIIEFGYKLIISDVNPDCYCARYATELVAIDTFDIKGNLRIAEVLKNKYNISAVVTIAADCHETVAYVSKSLGLPGISHKISHICRYKDLTRKALTIAGIPQPKYASVKSLEEARKFLSVLGGKGVLKATDSSGSRGFTKIDNINELTSDVFERALEFSTTDYIVLEEVLIPRNDCIAELSVETIWHNGAIYWLNWVDRLFRSDLDFFPGIGYDNNEKFEWGVEIGHLNPAQHSYETKKKIHDMIFQSGMAIGFGRQKGTHILKADIMLTPDGPRILELTPRLSGGWDSSGTTPARGADFQGGVIRLALGAELDLEFWHAYFEYQQPDLHAAVMTMIKPGAKDCIGRKFALGSGYSRENAMKQAINNLKQTNYEISLV